MNGVDIICFTAGLGENNGVMRQDVCSYLEFMGVKIDPEANNVRGEERLVSAPIPRLRSTWFPPTRNLRLPERRPLW